MPKWVKTILALLLLPTCVGEAQALWRVVAASGDASTIWVAMGAGAACWFIIFALLPKPMWLYVFGHELTHALWTWLSGGSVKKFKVTSEGGHVVVSKTNFFIALSPYFFPLYTGLVVLVFLLGQWLWGWRAYLIWFHLCVGATYAFHLTLTWHILQTRQTDITSQGWIFSTVIIFLGNVTVLLLAVPLLAEKVAVVTALRWWWELTGQTWQQLGWWLAWAWKTLRR